MHQSLASMLKKEQEWEQKLKQAHSNAKRLMTNTTKKGEALIQETQKKAKAAAKTHTDAVAKNTQELVDEIQQEANKRIQHIKAFNAEQLAKQLTFTI